MKRLLSNFFTMGIILLTVQCKQDTAIPDSSEQIRSFSELIAAVGQAEPATQVELVEDFMDSVQTPYVEERTNAYFLYFGEANNVQVAGDFNGWNPSGTSFTKLGETDLWYRPEVFESNARLDYKLVLNGSSWILDPKNPNQIGGGFGPNSELAMPDYVHPEEIVAREGIEKGMLSELQISSTATGKAYDVYVYLPASYDESNAYGAVYFQDGSDYLNLASSINVLDNLIADERIVPVIGVFVVPNNRNVEYAFDDRFKYADFFVSELVPYIDANYATSASAESRAVIGDSYGGNISAIIAFQNPDVFGNCGIHSGAFQPNNFDTNSIVMDGEPKDVKVATIWGIYEGSSLPPNMRKVRDYLLETGYNVVWNELPEGHSWGLWRATTDDMLEFFFSVD